MSLPSSLLSYEPQLQFMDIALDEERGARMFFTKESSAEHFRMRCNYARVLHREENKKIHEEGMPLHGKSEYDVLVFTIKTSPDGFWCYAEKQILDVSRVEPIPIEDEAPLIDATQITMENANDDEATAG
jgi:hypothetical protein